MSNYTLTYSHTHSKVFLISGTIEESRGETLIYQELKENFIKYFSFTPAKEHIKEAVEEIKRFLQSKESNLSKD